jgi:LAO/AO transport system kinase
VRAVAGSGVAELVAGLEGRQTAALARAISLVENGREGYQALLAALHPKIGRAHRLGVTGPPGAGKSTLTEGVIRAYRRRGLSVGVVAVDPTSPFSGGALLGDRIRMEAVSLDAEVFIRSMATRGAAGGLATTSREVCDVLDAYGFDRLIIETVGVGQAELAITASADTAVLVLVPESGDGVQVLKAGIMEVADLFVVNKADRPGAERLQQEVEVMLGLRRGNAFRHVAAHHGRTDGWTGGATPPADHPSPRPTVPEAWEPPVLLTVATEGRGIEDVVDAVERHHAAAQASGELERRRRAGLERLTRDVVERTLRQLVWDSDAADARLVAGLDRVVRGTSSPYQLAQDIVAGLTKGSDHDGA